MRWLSGAAIGAASMLGAAQSYGSASSACATLPLPPDPPGVKTTAKVERVGSRLRATIHVDIDRDRLHGERVIEGESCEVLASSAAAVLAMVGSPRDDGEAPAPVAEVDEAPAQRPSAAAASRPLVVVRLEAVADTSMLPTFAVGGGVALGLIGPARARFEIHGGVFQADERVVAEGRGARFGLVSFGARACWSVTSGVEVAPCAGVELARLSASAFGVPEAKDSAVLVVAPEAGLTLGVPLAGPLFLRAGVAGIVPTSRQSFVILGYDAVHQVPVVAFRTFLGAEVRF